jgi:hypothetical protein
LSKNDVAFFFVKKAKTGLLGLDMFLKNDLICALQEFFFYLSPWAAIS